MIARWPGVIKAGSITAQVGHVVDFMPTLLELSGAKYPAQKNDQLIPSFEGTSLLPTFRGEELRRSQPLCWYLYGNRAIRQGRWKLVWGVTGKKWELYDMKADRTETRDLAKKYPQRVVEMTAAWLEWAKRTGVPLSGSAL